MQLIRKKKKTSSVAFCNPGEGLSKRRERNVAVESIQMRPDINL